MRASPATCACNKGISSILSHGSYAFVGRANVDTPLLLQAHVSQWPLVHMPPTGLAFRRAAGWRHSSQPPRCSGCSGCSSWRGRPESSSEYPPTQAHPTPPHCQRGERAIRGKWGRPWADPWTWPASPRQARGKPEAAVGYGATGHGPRGPNFCVHSIACYVSILQDLTQYYTSGQIS